MKLDVVLHFWFWLARVYSLEVALKVQLIAILLVLRSYFWASSVWITEYSDDTFWGIMLLDLSSKLSIFVYVIPSWWLHNDIPMILVFSSFYIQIKSMYYHGNRRFCELVVVSVPFINKFQTWIRGPISETFGELIFYSFILHSVVLVFSGTFSEDHWMLQDSKDPI